MPRRPRPVMQRILERTEIVDRGYATPCWIFTGSLDRYGYGRVYVGGEVGRQGSTKVHVVAHEVLTGPLPEGLVRDHLCEQRDCWCPDHIQATTQRHNVLRSRTGASAVNARKVCCPRCGSEYKSYAAGRRCLPCRRAGQRASRRAAA